MTARTRVDYIAIEEEALLKFQFALIDAMNDAGLTKAQLAKALGVSKARVSQLLDSEANPTLKVIARAMHFLNREVEYVDISAQEDGEERPHVVDQIDVSTKHEGIASYLSLIHDSEPVWDVHEEHVQKPANEQRLWAFHNEAQAA